MDYRSNAVLTYVSILHRNTNRYFSGLLEKHRIGSGQQFFLLRIFENEGITMYDLAKLGNYDKGTVTKAVKKLADEGYVVVSVDPQDKRIRHLKTTTKALPLIEGLYHMRDEWIETLLESLDEESQSKLLQQLKKMADDSCENLEAFLNTQNSFLKRATQTPKKVIALRVPKAASAPKNAPVCKQK